MITSLWLLLLYVSLAGMLGGIVNALMTDNGFFLPKKEDTDGRTIYRPGFVANILIGAVAAVVSWGLYGPLAAYFIAGTQEAMRTNVSPDKIGVTLSSLVGAVLIGVGGARWLTNEVDKTLLKAAASKAAGAAATPDAATLIAMSSPADAYRIAKGMR